MKTKITLSLFLVLFISQNCFSQYDANNILKYYKYKERFQNNFISSGEGFGKSIPYSHRNWQPWDLENNKEKHRLEGGEHTLVLGNYIGFLGTEFKLFSQSNISTDNTIKELFYALKAFNRLDYYAETQYSSGHRRGGEKNFEPLLNGFFIREDIPKNFLSDNQNLNAGTIPADIATNYGYQKGSGKTIPVNINKDESKGGRFHTPMSQDHAIRMMWGLMLAYKCLDEGITYNQQEFLDSETDLKKEIRNIYMRIVEYLIKNKNSIGVWQIKDPHGKVVDAGGTVAYKYDIKLSYQIMKNNFNYPSQPPRQWINYGIGGNGWMNGRMQIEAQNLSGNISQVWNRSYKLGYEPYFINYGKIVHEWNFDSEKEKLLKETSEFYLNLAPCDGLFFHNKEDYSQFGWATPDRSERSFEDTYFGIHTSGNYNGLDYLLLHNLYYLNNFEKLGQFPSENLSDCQIDCSKINKEIKTIELERVQKRLKKRVKKEIKSCKGPLILFKVNDKNKNSCKGKKRTCKTTCKEAKKTCKTTVKDTKKACLSACNSKRGKAKRKCKRACRKAKRKSVRSCRKTKRTCKKDCRIEKRECKKQCKEKRKEYELKIEELKTYCN